MTAIICAIAITMTPTPADCQRGGHARSDFGSRGGASVLIIESNTDIGRRMARARGWVGEQWVCLQKLWSRESGWDEHGGSLSRAYGIPQSLPGSKMRSAGDDWIDNPATQIRWGLGYIAARYGSPCVAYAHSNAHNYY